MESSNAVLVVGSANMDMVVSCERFPQPGETVLARDFGMYPGGKGANQAVACAKLGGHVYLLGKMGEDVFEEQLMESLAHDGVQLEHVLTDAEAPTGIALISVDGQGENQIMVVSGSNMRLTPDEVAAKRDLFKRARIVLLQLEIPLETVQQAAELAKEEGTMVILNPAPAQELPDALLQHVDYLTPNETEAATLSGIAVADVASAEKAARMLLARGVGCVIVTLGAEGALLCTPERCEPFEAERVEAVDTTAAGDAFNGALAFSLAAGKSLDEALQLANTVAGYAVTKMGAQTSMPTREALAAWTHRADAPHAEQKM